MSNQETVRNSKNSFGRCLFLIQAPLALPLPVFINIFSSNRFYQFVEGAGTCFGLTRRGKQVILVRSISRPRSFARLAGERVNNTSIFLYIFESGRDLKFFLAPR